MAARKKPPARSTPPAAPAGDPPAAPPAGDAGSPPPAGTAAPAKRRPAQEQAKDAEYWRRKYERVKKATAKPKRPRSAPAAGPANPAPKAGKVDMAVKTPPVPREKKRRLIRATEPVKIRLFG